MSGMRDFLGRVLPWESAGDGVWFNVHWKAPISNPIGKLTHYWDGRPAATLDELVKQINFWANGDNKDAYICMSSQNRFEEKTSKANKPYRKAVRFQANVVALKSFYIDIDVKPDAYETTQEALDAFQDFISVVGLPVPSACVGSGSGGFHAHWTVDRCLTLAEWQPIANALAFACQQLGLICDTQCSIDSARILRIPGTLNWKTNPPNPVTLMSIGEDYPLDRIAGPLEPFMGFTPVGNVSGAVNIFEQPFEQRAPIEGVSDLSSGIEEPSAARPSIFSLGDQCPFVKNALETGGEGLLNPAWYMTLNIASFTEEGEVAAHIMSDGHASYSEEETGRQYDRVVRDHESRDIGWPSCGKIQLAGASECATCPLRGYNKSPFNFVEAKAPTPIDPSAPIIVPMNDTWPENYTRRVDGYVYILRRDESGNIKEERVSPYKISEGWVQNNPWTLHFTTVTAVGKQQHIEVSLDELGALGGARKTLGSQGLVFNDKDFKLVQEFLVAWIQKLQASKGSVVTSAPYGWVQNDNKQIEGFAFGGRVWGSGVNRQTSIADPELADVFAVKGEMQPWIDACRMITNQRRPELDVLVAASFAAPLTRFTGHTGLILSAFSSKSGVGKSSALSVGVSVWGQPKRGRNQLDDTKNQTFKKFGLLKSLPLYWDELQSQKQVDEMAGFVFNVMGGRDKNRLTGKLKMAKTEEWESLMVCACNYSLIDPILQRAGSHNAGLMRVLEIEVPKPGPNAPGTLMPGEAQRTLGALEDNYGWAGAKYAQFLGANYERCRKEVADMQNRCDKGYHVTRDERYWPSLVAVLVKGADYANELGLTQIDVPAMQKMLDGVMQKMRGHVQDSDVDLGNEMNFSSLFQQFMAEMRTRHTLVTNRVHVGAGKPVKGSIMVLGDASKMDGMFIQIGHEDKIVRISSRALDEWLRNRKPFPIPKHAFLSAMDSTFHHKKTVGYIGSGTNFRSEYKEYLYEINGNNFKQLWED